MDLEEDYVDELLEVADEANKEAKENIIRCPYDQAQCEYPGCRNPNSSRFDPECK